MLAYIEYHVNVCGIIKTRNTCASPPPKVASPLKYTESK